MLRRFVLAAVCAAMFPLVPAVHANGTAVQVSDAWVRPMDAGADATSAVYATIRNAGAEADTLLSASTPVASAVELHRMTMGKDGMMQMRPLKGGIKVPAHGQVQLKPGGYHVMLIGLKAPIAAGEQVAVTLHFAKAGDVTVQAAARQTAAVGGGMSGMGGHEMGKH